MKLIRDKEKTAKPVEKIEESSVTAKTSGSPQILKKQAAKPPSVMPIARASSWKILVVDDEPEVHAVTKLTVGDLKFEEKPVQLLSAMSGKEAQEILKQEPYIAVALIDVVMETEDAGLRLVNYIRTELNNQRIRLIIRTGQPGVAPERYVIDHYDIDDYKDKTELTTERLYTTLRTTLKAYRDLTIIDINRQGLEKILTAAPNLYRIQPMEQFLEGVLTQMTSLCNLSEHSLIAMLNSTVAQLKKSNIVIQVGTGKFSSHSMNDSQVNRIIRSCELILQGKEPLHPLPKQSLLLPMALYDQILGFIYLEEVGFLTDNDQYLLQIMTTQCAAALKNLKLYSHLEEANRQNERKNQFLGMAAHDLRNPLGVILGYGELLQEETLNILDEEQLDYLNRIHKASQFTLNLVNNLLDVAKIESGNLVLELEQADLIATITEAISLNRFLAESKQIQLNFDYDDNLPEMIIDTYKVQQFINNLISNAIKYSHPQTEVKIAVTQKQPDVLISVTDEGQGIPEAELDKLFQPFSKTSVKSTAGESSTGLGLLICRQTVEAHGGKIWVESQVGVGSTFYVLLPPVPQPQNQKDEFNNSLQAPPFQKCEIL
jgi:signal transduction histidine kinase/CheY-like chemotaxis protein